MLRLRALRAAARIARRDARRAKGRTALVAVLVGLPVCVGTAGAVLLQSSEATDATYTEYVLGPERTGPDQVQARIGAFTGSGLQQSVRADSLSWGGNPAEGSPTVEEHEQALTDALPDGNRLLRTVRTEVEFSTAERAAPSAPVVVLATGGDLSGVFPVGEGDLPGTADEVALAPTTVERLGVAVGDTVTMELDDRSRAMTVTGHLAPVAIGGVDILGPGAIAAPESASAGHPVASASTTTELVQWYVLGPEPVTWDDVLDVNEAGSPVISRAVLLDPPPPGRVPYSAGAASSVDSGTLAFAGGVAAIVLLEAILLIGPAFAVGARRNERQLAMLAAAGAERRTLRQVVLITGVVTGLAAAAGGVLLGLTAGVGVRAVVVALGHPFAFPDLRVPWLALVGFVVFGALVAGLAAWLPSRRAAKVDVVAALAGRRPAVRHRSRLAVVGGAAALVGLAGAVAGAVMAEPIVLVTSVIALELGVIAVAGPLISLSARLAPRLGAIGRIALRDASRNRARTAPAVAAVIAAIAGITAGAVYLQSGQDRDARHYAPFAATGTVAVDVPAAELMTVAEAEDVLAAATTVIKEHLPVTDISVVTLAVPTGPSAGDHTWLTVRTPPENECPSWAPDVGDLSDAEHKAAARDERCRHEGVGGEIAWMGERGATTLVDDGTVVRALGFPGSDAASRALADGRAVVGSDLMVRTDGVVRVAVEQYEVGAEEPVAGPEIDLAAEVVALPGVQYGLVLPPEALDRLEHGVYPAGLVATTTREPSSAEVAAARAALGAGVDLKVERGNPFGTPSLELLLLVAAAAVVGLGATGISVALAAAESRPDLATLAAIGAAPRTRRRFAAAQAAVISGLGTSLGVLAGLALGWVLVTAQRYRWDIPDYGWQLSIPWAALGAIAVGLPLLAVAVGYVATRSRLPVARRVAP